MSSSADAGAAELAAEYRIANAPFNTFPYPHLYLRDVFPADYYAEIQRQLPAPEALVPLEQARGVRGYPERSVMMLGGERPAGMPEPQYEFWRELAQWMLGGRFAQLILRKFGAIAEERLKDMPEVEIFDELMLVHDRSRFSLGPHTDSPLKLVSMLFYLPADERLAGYGTSIYVPREPGFECPGGPHHSFEDFKRVATMPFLPNALFAFPKTRNSFHGVEPIAEAGVGRYLLLYDLRLRRIETGAAAPAAGPRVQFRF